ncbi:hypothetical protein ACFFQF_19510 [Haladaptatus pallidirubidus]
MSEEQRPGNGLSNRPLRWLLVDGNRVTLAGVFLGGVFLFFADVR